MNIEIDKKEFTNMNEFVKKREEIIKFIGSCLTEGVDYGISDPRSKKKSLLKSGAQKILQFMKCKVMFKNDIKSWEMLGARIGTVCMIAYIIPNIPNQPTPIAIGEGRGACDVDEKRSKDGTEPKMSTNRTIKMAEKRAEVDAVIRTFALNFAQDQDYVQQFGDEKGDDLVKIAEGILAMKIDNEPIFLDDEKEKYLHYIKNVNVNKQKDSIYRLNKIVDERKAEALYKIKKSKIK